MHNAKALRHPLEAIADASVDAVLIASSTNTHADLIEAAARSGKAVFCEKPIDLDIGRVAGCLDVIGRHPVPLMVGFNRRFDPHVAAVKDAIRAGSVGDVEMIVITSRDPQPPPLDYVRVSGGLWRDSTIHDLDLARWLLDEEPVEVFARGSNLVDPAIGVAGDVDTAMTVLRTASGRMCFVNNSRRCAYGFDQRVEVFGSRGMVQTENLRMTATRLSNGTATAAMPPLMHFFLERYAESYRVELEAFVDAVLAGRAPDPSADDGYRALVLADAAVESNRSGRAVRVDGGSTR
jgi:myo-inositol 2-dehydrogenase/D-chiro-inositol 1-dehydrogenase